MNDSHTCTSSSVSSQRRWRSQVRKASREGSSPSGVPHTPDCAGSAHAPSNTESGSRLSGRVCSQVMAAARAVPRHDCTCCIATKLWCHLFVCLCHLYVQTLVLVNLYTQIASQSCSFVPLPHIVSRCDISVFFLVTQVSPS